MTNCPEARRRFPLVLAAGAMALILAAGPAAPAQAQDEDSEPIRLLPGAASEELTSGEEQPSQSLVTITDPEDEDEELEGDDATAEDENEDDEPVAVSPLRALDSSSVGVLGPEDGGLGPRLWEGASRPRIESLIARLPVVTESRAMKTLTRALLLTSAPVPEGEATVPSLLGLRVERLAAAGDMKGALDLVQVAPPGLEDPVLARVETDGFFLSGDHSGACTVVEREVANGRAGVYWIKGLSFCRALREEIKAARLGADLLREIGETGDEAFFTLIAALAGDPGATVVSLPDPRPLHIAMLRVAGQDIPADAVAGAGPALLRAIATAPNTDIAVKLAAGERAEALGALSPESLAQIYASVPFTSDELNNAVSIALKENSPRSRALLFQVGQIQTVPAARAEAMREAARVADLGMSTAFAVIRPGVTCGEVIAEGTSAMLKAGAESVAMAPAAGVGTYYLDSGEDPRRVIAEGDMVFIDMGIWVHGYLGDITRAGIVGEGSAEQCDLLKTVQEAYTLGSQAMVPGADGKVIYQSVVDHFAAKGWDKYYVHHLSHGLGLGGDWPRIAPDHADILEVGDALSCEPGVYIPGLGGARVENMVYVDNGGPEEFTKSPLDLPMGL